MIARLSLCPVLALLAAGALTAPMAVKAQTPQDAGTAAMRASLGQRQLWGRDYPLLIASLPAWAQIQEKTVTVAADVIFGGTRFATREEADKRAGELRRALSVAPSKLSPSFARIAGEAGNAVAAAERVGIHRYGTDNSYRVVIGLGLSMLPPELKIVEVRRLLGKELAVKSDVEDGGGEYRPIIYATHVWDGGALLYQTSNYAPTPDQVVRVVLSVPVALRAVEEKP